MVEPLSLDEAYLDVTDSLRGHSDCVGDREANQGAHLQRYQAHGLGRNFLQQVPGQDRVGHSQTKWPVRDHARPGGGLCCDPASREIPRRWSKDDRQDAPLGVETGADLRGQTLDVLQRNFGKAGSWYYEIARGQDDRPVQADRERKSSGSETTFSEDLIDPAQIEARVIAMADDVWAWCEKANARGRTVTVKIKWADFQISTRSRSMDMTIRTQEKLHELALGLIRSVFPPPKGIRLVGVTLSNFQAQSGSEAAELPLS